MTMFRGYITNLKDYNNGKLNGTWLEFPCDDKAIDDALKIIGCDEAWAEYFFTDFESDYNIDVKFFEYSGILELNEKAEAMEEWDTEKLEAVCELWPLDEVLEVDEDRYYFIPEIEDEYDLGRYLIEETGLINTSELGFLQDYIDYAAYGRNVNYATCGGFVKNGWVELM